MQLIRTALLVLAATTALTAAAAAQSLSPMHKSGTTPTEIKGFRLLVGNPYPTRMTFVVVAMTPDFTAPASDAQVAPSEVRLAPNTGRSVLVKFRIGSSQKERTIGVCVVPKDIEGPVLPPVCGTYTGIALGQHGG